MIEINGKVYRNLQEQVGKNKEDIESIKSQLEDDELVINGLSEDITDIKADIVDIKNDITSLKNRVSTLESKHTHRIYVEAIFSAYKYFFSFVIENNEATKYTTAEEVFNAFVDEYGRENFVSCSGHVFYTNAIDILNAVSIVEDYDEIQFKYLSDNGTTGTGDELNYTNITTIIDNVD